MNLLLLLVSWAAFYALGSWLGRAKGAIEGRTMWQEVCQARSDLIVSQKEVIRLLTEQIVKYQKELKQWQLTR